nr:StaP-like cytochrome P450 [uncultured bacterium]
MMRSFSPKGWPAEDVADPYPVYRRWRETDPVHEAEPGTWYLFRHDDIAHALSSKDFGRNSPAHIPGRNDALRRSVENWLVFMDPPRHTHLRRLLAARFSSRVVSDLRPRIAAVAAELLSPLTTRPQFDLVSQFAAPLPVLVISELLGVPGSLHTWFRERAEWLQGASSSRAARDPDAFTKAETASRELTEFFREEVRRRRTPGPDLVSLLADTSGLTIDEVTATCVHLLTAGHETTTNLLGKSVLALSSHPTVADRLRTHPEVIPAAVDELIRYDAPVQMVTRWATRSQSLGGREISAGDKVVLVLGSANRDPDRFAEPDELCLDRDTSRHCGFGMGIHYCLGAQLARAEVEIALPLLLDLLRRRTVSEVRYGDDMVFHGPARLVLSGSGVPGRVEAGQLDA